MLNIMRADLYRIFRGKGLYITIILLFAFITLQIAVSSSVTLGISTDTNQSGAATAFTGMAAPFQMMDVTDNFLYFILPFIIFIGAADFSSGTAKNVLTNGMSRAKYYLSKLILSCIVCTILMLLYVILPIIIGTIMNGFGGTFDMVYVGSILRPFLTQLFLCISVTCVGTFFVFVTKRTAAVNGAYIAFCLLPMILMYALAQINDKLAFLLNYDIVSNIRMLANIDSVSSTDVVRAMYVAKFYILASTIGGIAIFKRSEIK